MTVFCSFSNYCSIFLVSVACFSITILLNYGSLNISKVVFQVDIEGPPPLTKVVFPNPAAYGGNKRVRVQVRSQHEMWA